MKKLLLIFIVLITVSSINVKAEECTDNLLNTYEKYVSLLDFSFEQMGSSETFKIYVSNISTGISVESGKWISSDGFLDYISYGSSKYINILVSDGGICAGEIIKIMELSVDGDLYYFDTEIVSDKQQEDADKIIIENSSLINEELEGYSFNDEYIFEETVTYNEEIQTDIYAPPVINQNEKIISVDDNNTNYTILALIILIFFLIILKFNKKIFSLLKKISRLSIFIIISFTMICTEVFASEYESVTKEIISYEINNFYIKDGSIIINGWAIIDGDVQHFIDESTHTYSLYIENKYDSSDSFEYQGIMLEANKTEMYKYTTTTKVCSPSSTYNDAFECYTRYENVGFEFTIDLDDLSYNAEYEIILRVEGKTANVKYEIVIYAPGLLESFIENGTEYELVSDYSTLDITVISTHLFVRSGPSTSLNEVYGSYSVCSYGTRLYWAEYETFSTIQEVYKESDNYDSNTWFRLLYNEGLCQDSRSRAIMGYSYSGWIASAHTDFSGTPAVIKTTLLESLNLDEIVTYTAKSGSKGKVELALSSEINQSINIKIYYEDDLVIDENKKIYGEEEVDFSFKLIKSGEVKVILTEENGVEHVFLTEIFISSLETYYVSENEITINPSTPIMVIKSGNNVDYKYEEINASIPYSYIFLSSGSPFYTWTLINYTSENNNIKLNTDIYSYALFPSKENTLDYILNSSNQFFVELIKTDYNSNQALYNVSVMYLSNPEGSVYSSSDNLINYVNGGRMWYTPIDEAFGMHEYSINIENVGVNGISIYFNCTYETKQTIFGSTDSEYIIKRVEVPSVVEYILYKTYNSSEIGFYQERISI